MLVVVLVTCVVSASGNTILYQEILEPRGDGADAGSLSSCVAHILRQHYARDELLTFVDAHYGDDRLLRHVHALATMSIVYRNPKPSYFLYHRAYLITARNATDFTRNFPYLAQEPSWNPYARFLIVIKFLKGTGLKQIFDTLMKYFVLNVVIVNGTDPFLYTYNPYEDFACGKYYNRVINFGRCPTTEDLYPDKLVTGMRRCTLAITVPHWPPYAMHPSRITHGMQSKGVEQTLMEIIGEREHFNITYIYKDNGEEYSKISRQMAATGPFQMLQNNETDLMLGGLVLTALRSAAFAYTSSHLDQFDEVKILVKKALNQPVWKNIYLEFQPLVWLLLVISLLTFSFVMIVLLRIKDKVQFVLMLWDTLLLHGRKIQYTWTGKFIFIFWVWFAYLICCFYQSDLSSLTTGPGREKQVSDIEDIKYYKMKPCLSSAIDKLLIERNMTIPFYNVTDCYLFNSSIKEVSTSHEMFTIVLYSVYNYQKQQFYDEYGNDHLYSFKNPLFRVSYSVYMNKGYPLKHRLDSLMIRLRENGLVLRTYKYQYDMLTLVHRFKHKDFHPSFLAPWHVYALGLVVSIVIFFLEVFKTQSV